jgi:Tetracyclin repressor-like, C-terminal domain
MGAVSFSERYRRRTRCPGRHLPLRRPAPVRVRGFCGPGQCRNDQYELAALTPGHYADILELRRQTTDMFRQAVIRGIDEGTFAAVDVHRVVRAMLSLGVDLVRRYRTGGPGSPEQLGEFYAGLASA